MDGQLKRYYLMQLAFYLHQVIAINLEKRRKDYKQMFTHHVITCCLMYICYAYRYTKMGNVILCIMDVVDFFLPVSALKLMWMMLILSAGKNAELLTLGDGLQHDIRCLSCNMAHCPPHHIRLTLLVDIS